MFIYFIYETLEEEEKKKEKVYPYSYITLDIGYLFIDVFACLLWMINYQGKYYIFIYL